MSLLEVFHKVIKINIPYIPDEIIDIWDSMSGRTTYIQATPEAYMATIKGKQYNVDDLVQASERRNYSCRY